MPNPPGDFRIGAAKLERLRPQLTGQDFRLLERMEQHRYLTTEQAARFTFDDPARSRLARLKAAHRALKRLRALGAVTTLDRAVGGVRGGSAQTVWTLTTTGVRLHYGGLGQSVPRRRLIEPSTFFLAHELAVAELHLALLDATSEPGRALPVVETEPDCWRSYLGGFGSVRRLRPDLYAVATDETSELFAYFEVDRSTEPPRRVIDKCLQYQEYYRNGDERRRVGVLPAVVWVVPDERRREQLFAHLSTEHTLTPGLYRVLLLPEIEAFVRGDDEIGRLPDQPKRGGEA